MDTNAIILESLQGHVDDVGADAVHEVLGVGDDDKDPWVPVQTHITHGCDTLQPQQNTLTSTVQSQQRKALEK